MVLKEVILHVGSPKTATSSIQATLYSEENKNILNSKNYYYVEGWNFCNSKEVASLFLEKPELFHINVSFSHGIEQIKELNVKYEEFLVQELSNPKLEKLIITSEEICFFGEKDLKNIKEFFINKLGSKTKFKVMYFVRHPVLLGTSLIAQGLGTLHYNESFNYVNGLLKNYNKIKLVNLENVFTKECVSVYTFEDACKHPQGPVGFFFQELGFSHEELGNIAYKKENEAKCMEVAEILNYINIKAPFLIKGVKNEKRYMNDFIELNKVKGVRFSLKEEELGFISETTKKDILWLYEKYGIDYKEIPENKVSSDSLYSDDTLKYIVIAFKKLKVFLRELIIDFFEMKAEKTKDTRFARFSKELKDMNHAMIFGEKLIDKIKTSNEFYELADIYRDLAVFFEDLGDIEHASKMMAIAYEIRPSGGFIEMKHNEYKKMLDHH